MRKVMVSHYVFKTAEVIQKDNKGIWQLTGNREAVFHQFGCNYEEFKEGPGNFSTAIVEYDDGSVDNVPVEHIRFITPNDQK